MVRPLNKYVSSLGRYRGLPREIYILFVARIVNSLGAFVHPLLTMILTTKLGMKEDEAGVLITILLATQMPVMLLGGKLADKFGRRKLIIVFQFLGAATYIACGLVPLSHTTIYLMMTASYFYALTFPALDAVTMDLTNTDQRKEAYALLYMGFNLGFVFGPTIGGLLLESHLSLLFIGDAVTTIISTVLYVIFIRETLPKKGEKDEPMLEKYAEESVFSILWKRKIIIVFALIMMVLQFTYSQWTFALPLQMKELFGGDAGPKLYGVLASFNGLLVIVLTPLVTPLVRRRRALTGTLAGGIMYAVAFAMLIIMKELYLFYVSMFIFTLGEVIMTIDAGVFVAGMMPSSHRGRLDSVYSSITTTGRVVSPMIIGWVISASSLSLAWVVLSGAAVVGCMALYGLIRSKSGKKQIDMVDAGTSLKESI
jgi:MFS family permease